MDQLASFLSLPAINLCVVRALSQGCSLGCLRGWSRNGSVTVYKCRYCCRHSLWHSPRSRGCPCGARANTGHTRASTSGHPCARARTRARCDPGKIKVEVEVQVKVKPDPCRFWLTSTSILLNRRTRKSRSDLGFGRMPKEIRIVARLAAKRPGPKDPSLQWNRATRVFVVGSNIWVRPLRALAILLLPWRHLRISP